MGATAATTASLPSGSSPARTPADPGDGLLASDAVEVPVQPDRGGHRVGAAPSGPTEYGLHGTRWTDPDLTYGFVNHTADLSVAAQEAAVARALATWSSVTPAHGSRRFPIAGWPSTRPTA